MTSTYILNEPGSTKCNVNHHRKMTYTRTHVRARTRSRIFWKHVLWASATKIMTDRTHSVKATAVVEICTQCTAVLYRIPRQKVIVSIVVLLADIKPYLTLVETINCTIAQSQYFEKSKFRLSKAYFLFVQL